MMRANIIIHPTRPYDNALLQRLLRAGDDGVGHRCGDVMKRGFILELVPKDGFDIAKVVENYANGRPVELSACDLKLHPSIVDSFRPEFVDYIAKYGLSALLRREPLTEALVAPGTSSAAVQSLLKGFLSALSVTTDLIVIDPYFFAPTTDKSYPALIGQILYPVLATLQTLTVVTLPNKVDAKLAADVTAALMVNAPRLIVAHKTSNAFHDRFWIDPISTKGFLCGTSLNGLGKRYAMVDHLEPTDAADVLSALRSESLL
jgi:hypothetical protein